MKKLKFTKIQAARVQVDTAIRLLFENESPVVVHTLAMAALGILKALAKKKRVATHPLFSDYIRPGKEGDFWMHIFRGASYFKHADLDPDVSFDNFSELTNDCALFICCMYFNDLGQPPTHHMKAFLGRFSTVKPQLLKNEESRLKAKMTKQWQENTRRLSRKQ